MSELIKKNINYLSKDFGQYRQNLINFVKTYFPDTYNDFNETSPGMMFLEMASYVGDVLSFATDVNLKESIITRAEEKQNLFALSQALGYKPKNSIASSVELDVFQIVPSIGSNTNVKPDYNYSLKIKSGMVVGSSENSNVEFRTLNRVDFSYSSSLDNTDVTVYKIDSTTKEPLYYLLKKKVKAISGRIQSENFNFGDPKEYDKILIDKTNIIEIIDVYDSDGNKWYEVPYLAQDTIFDTVLNNNRNTNTLNQYSVDTPYLLKLKKVDRRFITRVRSDNKIEIQFGAGISSNTDDVITPTPDLVGSSLWNRNNFTNFDLDPSNFLFTKTYGLAPSNTELTVRYSIGGGVLDNVRSGELTNIINIEIENDTSTLDRTLYDLVRRSVSVSNDSIATGGKETETIEEIRNNAMSYFASQNRAVTKEDYIVRTYSLPPKYGAVAKAYITQDDLTNNDDDKRINPLALNLYVLGYNADRKLVNLNRATKENLKNYLDFYRVLSDSINIKNAYIINIGVDFEILTLPNYNSNEVIIKCIDRLKKYFAIDKWQINQPIVISDIYTQLDRIEGVQTVTNVKIQNYWSEDDGYSGNIYDLSEATRDNIIYPSMDPSIFEIKYPNKDIQGRTVNFNG